MVPRAFIHKLIFQNLRSFSSYTKNMSLEKAKELAAHQAVDDYVNRDMTLGIGSGSTGKQLNYFHRIRYDVI